MAELFNQKDADNFEQIKNVMAEKALSGDAGAATAFSHLLKLQVTTAELEKASAASSASSWLRVVNGSGRAPAEADSLEVA